VQLIDDQSTWQIVFELLLSAQALRDLGWIEGQNIAI
jgi:hypothetical protein